MLKEAIFALMKKVLPVIVILIILSLLGIIIIQVNWVNNQALLQQERFIEKVDKAGLDVAEELSRSIPGVGMPFNRRNAFPILPDDLSMNILRTPAVAERFSIAEINIKLKKAFSNEGLNDLRYEFAITSNSDDFILEMISPHFQQESMDTLHFRRRVIPIIPETGSELEGLLAYEHLFIIIPDFNIQVWRSLIWVILFIVLFTAIIIAAFVITLSALLKQKKISEMKSDFINNMTHELKTPIATISLSVDALNNHKVQNNPEKLAYFTNIIREENKRMNRHVETILQAALLDKQELKIHFTKQSLHELISKVGNNFQLQLVDKNGRIEYLFNATEDMVMVAENHFSNMINNLIDNAIKYSKENPLIKISTRNNGNKYFIIQIEDNGIGMNKETVRRVFEKFYRAHTGNVHNVKGFGLGMSYVKTVLDAHSGRIKVSSIVGKGSTFTIELPMIQKAVEAIN